MGKSKRLIDQGSPQTPGPGTYSLRQTLNGPSYSLKNTRRPEKPQNVPGPGYYNPVDLEKSRNPGFPISRAERLSSYFSESPGPGSYNISPIKDGPEFKMSTQERLNSTSSKIPGPGAYIIPELHNSPAFSMTSRHSLFKQDPLPGPGAYTPKYLFKTIKYSLSRSEKMPFKPKNIPGPGSYMIKVQESPSAKFSLSPRKLIEVSLDSPGPGTYESRSSMDGPRFTLRGRKSVKPNDNPVCFM